MKKYLIGTDIGTSSTKTVITDLMGNILASATEFYEVVIPHNAWAEEWPDFWENAVRNTIRRVMTQSKVNPEEVASICISGLYGGSGVPLDENMEVVRPCIIWMDRRAEELCDKLRQTIDVEKLFKISENGIDSYFGFTKILWIKENEPENWEKIKLFMTPNQYVIWKLTGSIAIDRTSAGNYGGIFDFEKNDWSDEMLATLEIPKSLLPERIVNPTDIIGTLTEEAASSMKMAKGTPVCAGCIDCLASTLSSGVYSGNRSVTVLATSLNWGFIHNEKPRDEKYISMPYITNDLSLRYTYGGISTAGALTKWFAKTLSESSEQEFSEDYSNKRTFAKLEESAESIPAGSEGLICLPYFSGERTPIWDSEARGCFLGLTIKHSRAHLYRAVLESTGYALRHVMEEYHFNFDGTTACSIVGGGTASKLWVQILSDIAGVKFECMTEGVEAPIGDAFMAGIAGGLFKDFSEIERWTKSHMMFCPNWQNHEIYNQYYEIYKSLYISVKDEMHALAKLGFNIE